MAWVAVAIGGSALVGAGVGAYSAGQSADAIGSASNQQAATANSDRALQKQMYDQNIALNQPFYNTGVEANARLNAMVTGKDQLYSDPTYKAQTNQQSAANLWQQIQANHSLAGADFWKDIGNGEDPTQRILRDPTLSSQLQQSTKYVGPNGDTLDKQPSLSVPGGYDMKESPAATYELQQGTKSLNRQLAARGLLGSGNASQRLAELSSGVAANDYNQQYSRLLDQVKIGTGASAAAGAASQTYGNQINTTGQQTINAQGQAGQARASLYSGLGGIPGQALNTGINAYRSGLFDSSSGGSSLGASPATPDFSQYESVNPTGLGGL